MSDIPDQRLSPYQLPPLQQPQRALMPASLPALSEGLPTAESTGSLSPSDSSHVGFGGKARASPPALHREGTRDRRISAACAACKKRKSKCTGGPPPCKLCRIAGIECVINESLDGRRKLAAKRVQDELQQHKALLDGLIEGLRSPERSEKILELIRSGAPLAAISDYMLQPPAANNHEPRTRVPIELLIQAEEVLSQRTSDGEIPIAGESSASPHGRYTASPPTGTPGGLGLRPSASYPGVSGDDSQNFREFVQVLHDCSEHDAAHLMQELRRVGDISTFIHGFSRGITARNKTSSPNAMN